MTNPAYHFKRIGLEAGPLSQWLFSSVAEVGLAMICIEVAVALARPCAALPVIWAYCIAGALQRLFHDQPRRQLHQLIFG